MPEPSQTKHAEFIAFSRNIAQLNGITPNQVRQRLRAFNDDVEKRQRLSDNGPATQPAPVAAPLPIQQNNEVKFEPMPFTPRQAPAQPPPAAGGGLVGYTATVVTMFDGNGAKIQGTVPMKDISVL